MKDHLENGIITPHECPPSETWKLRQFLKELEDLIYHYKKL